MQSILKAFTPRALAGGSDAPVDLRRLRIVTICANLMLAATCLVMLVVGFRADMRSAEVDTINAVRLTERTTSALLDQAGLAARLLARFAEQAIDFEGSKVERAVQAAGLARALADMAIEGPSIALFDHEGQEICIQSAERCVGADIADRDYFRRLKFSPDDPVRLYGPHFSVVDSERALIMAKAVRSPDGTFAGVATASVALSRLRALLSVADMGEDGSAAIRSDTLELLVRYPELPSGGSVNRSGSNELKSAVRAEPGEGAYRSITTTDRVNRVIAYRKLPQYPLYVLAGQSVRTFLADVWLQAAWSIAILLLSAWGSRKFLQASAVGIEEREAARRLYDEAPCGYHTLAADGRYLSINATELGWLGCTREAVVGNLRATDFMPREEHTHFERNFAELKRVGSLAEAEFDLISRDGRVRRVIVSAKAVYDAQGRFVSTNSVMLDITALHEVRQSLRRIAAEQQVMLDSEFVGIARLRQGERLNWWNRGMERLLGYRGAEWENLPIRCLCRDLTSGLQLERGLHDCREEGSPYRVQEQLIRKDGSYFWADISAMAIARPVSRSPSFESDDVMILIADISALKKAEDSRVRNAELTALNMQLVETNRLKNQFIANMSHELRTPLHGMLGVAGLLESRRIPPGTDEHRRHLDMIRSSGGHLLGLIENILDMATIEAGKLTLDPSPTAVAAVVESVREMLRAKSAGANIAIVLDLAEGPQTVITDALRLRQMLINLIDNAIKFSAAGSTVQVRTMARTDDRWQIDVKDEGIGLSAEELERVFLPFEQISAGHARTHDGAGLGLSIVYAIAKAMGGHVEARSLPGQGTTFSLVLPIRWHAVSATAPLLSPVPS